MKLYRLIYFIIFFLIFGCFSQRLLYERVIEIDSIEQYEKYLADNPESEYRADIESRLEKKEYEQAIEQNNYKVYNNFLAKHTNSKFTEDVNERIQKLDYENVINSDKLTDYEEYLLKYPKGPFTENIKTQADMLKEYNLIKEYDRIEDYNSFLTKYPDSNYKSEIEKILEFKYTTSNSSRQDAIIFFNKYPNHPKRKIVWQKFRNSFYMSEKDLTRTESINAIVEILNEEYKQELSTYFYFLNNILKPSVDNKQLGKSFAKLRTDLVQMASSRPIGQINYDVLNIFSSFFILCTNKYNDALQLYSFESKLNGLMGASTTLLLLTSDAPINDTSVVYYPYYGNSDEWNAENPEILSFKNACLDMFEYNTNKFTSKDFLRLFNIFETHETNLKLKELIASLRKSAEKLAQQ